MTSQPRPAPLGRVAGRGWQRVTLSLFAVAFGTNVSTPLLLVYRERLHLSDAVVTTIFGAYAVGLVPAIVFSGPLSDRLGRRRVTVPFVALAAVSTALFVPAADAEWLLYVARFLQGVVSGVVFSVATAWLAELSGPGHHQAAGRRAAVAMTLGFSLGPLTSGLLGQWAPAPTVLPYLVHLVLMAAGLAALVGVPETMTAPATGPLLRIRLRPGTARAFWLLVAPTAVCVYGFPSVALTVVPLFLPRHAHQIAFTGLIGGITLGSGTLAALRAGRLGTRAAAVGVTMGALGYAVCAVALGRTAQPLALVGAGLLGIGNGLTLTAGLALTQRLADPLARGSLTSVFYGLAYLGFAAPYATTVVANRTSGATALAGLAGLSALLALWLAAQYNPMSQRL